MDKARTKKIDDFLNSVKERSEQRQAEREGKHEVTWESFSPESQEVLQYFGIDAPHVLNEYCCKVEDALFEIVERLKDAQDTIADLHQQLNIDS